jgi:hypothetical protein
MDRINDKTLSKEQRRMKRRHLIYYLEAVDRETDKLVGFLVDLTTKGIMLMSKTPIEAEKVFHLRILLRTDLSEKKYLNFDAKSKWCKKSVNTEIYDTGFELINTDISEFKEIEEIIDDLGFSG